MRSRRRSISPTDCWERTRRLKIARRFGSAMIANADSMLLVYYTEHIRVKAYIEGAATGTWPVPKQCDMLPYPSAEAAMLLISIVLALQTPIDSVALVTRDIPNFWRAYDSATGKPDAEQARAFRAVAHARGRHQRRHSARDSPGPREACRPLSRSPIPEHLLSHRDAVDRGNGGPERHAHGDGAERERPRYTARRAPRLGAERFPHAYFRIARWPRRARGGAYPAEAHALGPARHLAAPRARRRHRRFPLRARGGTVGGEHAAPDVRPRARTRRLG